MAVARKGCGKWASKLIADGFIPLHEQAGNLQHHIVSVVRHDAIQVRSGPGVVVIVDKRFDVKSGLDWRRSRHGCLLRWPHFTPLRFEPAFQQRNCEFEIRWPSLAECDPPWTRSVTHSRGWK